MYTWTTIPFLSTLQALSFLSYALYEHGKSRERVLLAGHLDLLSRSLSVLTNPLQHHLLFRPDQ